MRQRHILVYFVKDGRTKGPMNWEEFRRDLSQLCRDEVTEADLEEGVRDGYLFKDEDGRYTLTEYGEYDIVEQMLEGMD